MADQDRRDSETAHASAEPDDETAVLPDIRPTERVNLAWSFESESDFDTLADGDAPIPPMPPPAEPQSQARRTGTVLVVFWLLLAAALLYSCSKSESSTGESPPTSVPPPSPPPPPPFKTMPGDGTYNMGGADGKDWGMWESSGGPADNCQWSIRAVSRYTPGQVLDSGEAGMNQQTRVSIQPLPDSSGLTGEAHGFRVVFMTNGCGSWHLVD
ncbi:hypothetical protein PJN34_19245 [Mycobacterium kansasii]